MNKSFFPGTKVNSSIIWVDNAYEACASFIKLWFSQGGDEGLNPPLYIEPSSSIGKVGLHSAYAFLEKTPIRGKGFIIPYVYVGVIQLRNETS